MLVTPYNRCNHIFWLLIHRTPILKRIPRSKLLFAVFSLFIAERPLGIGRGTDVCGALGPGEESGGTDTGEACLAEIDST